jgi:conjugal transfer/entry exclusion protein
MHKKGKIIFILVIFMAVFSGPLFAQGYPVIDIANLMQAINTLHATYDQITAAIEQALNTCQQLQKQIEMVKNMDWDKVGETIGDMDVTSLDGTTPRYAWWRNRRTPSSKTC